MAEGLFNGALGVCRSAITFLKDRRQSRAARREFWALGRTECLGILNEMGMTQFEFDDAMRLPYASEDMLSCAMHSLGLIPTNFRSRQSVQERFMSRTCITCPHRRRCHRHIAASDFESSYQDFCPNRLDFSELLDERSGKSN